MDTDNLNESISDSMSLTKKKLIDAKIVDAQIENEVSSYSLRVFGMIFVHR